MKMISFNGIERPQFEPRARLGWRVVAHDLLGFGASSGDSGSSDKKTTLDEFASDLIALLDHLGVRGTSSS